MPEMEKGRAPENKRSRKPAHPVKRDATADMKSFAENTMNELLGWYSYEHTDPPHQHNHISVLKENSKPITAEKSAPSSSSEATRNPEREPVDTPLSPSSSSSSSVSPRIREQRNMSVLVPLIKPSAVEDVQNVQIVCVWCQKEGVKRYSLLMGSEPKSFCSEKCFTSCRRAYFKRNKARDEDHNDDQSPSPDQTLDTPTRLLLKMNNNTRVCDWCKHIRHTKEYLDFGSGEERLQFCSTKCLNQFKMDVFYREARAALKDEQNPQNPAENQNLLTPESWSSSPSKTPSSALNSSPSRRTPVSTTTSRGRSCVPAIQLRPPPAPQPSIGPPALPSPAPHPPRPIQRPPHPPLYAPPPLHQPYPAPFHLPPPWPQPTMLVPYPVIIPLPVPIPIPIPVSRLPGVTGSPPENEEDPRRIKTEQISLPSTTPLRSSERHVIQCLHTHPIKEELQAPDTPQISALRHHDGSVTSVVTPTASASLDNRTATPASLYSLARSTAIQITSVSLDSTRRSGPASDVTAGSAHIPSPLSDSENYSTNPWPGDSQSDQSKESMEAEDASQDVEHTYARAVPPELREKNAHAQSGAQTHSHTHTFAHTQTHNWVPQGSEMSGGDDLEPADKRRCLRIRDQNH